VAGFVVECLTELYHPSMHFSFCRAIMLFCSSGQPVFSEFSYIRLRCAVGCGAG